MKISSPAFAHGAPIPHRYSRYGDDRRPPLIVEDVPPGTVSLALILDDPDAPSGTFTHWVLFDLDPETRALPEESPLPGARQGRNSWREPGYGGPRPPDREHRYFFRLYALNRKLGLPAGVSRTEVEHAMRGHIIAEAQLMGRFAPPTTADAAPSRL